MYFLSTVTQLRYRFLIVCLLWSGLLAAQDTYHTGLRAELMNTYDLPAGTWLTPETESATLAAVTSYGNISQSAVGVTDQAFTSAHRITVNTAGPDPWSAGWTLSSQGNVALDDRVLLVVWLRAPAGGSTNVFVEDVVTFAKEVYLPVTLTDQWRRYLIAFEAIESNTAGELNLGLHLALAEQTIEVGGVALINYGKTVDLADLPNDTGNAEYAGFEADAAWRAPAAIRIDSLRKAELTLTVRGMNNVPAPDVPVQVRMLEHEYGFGTAVVACRLPGNSCYDAAYTAKLEDLDGEGHGFNTIVFENALKWRAWENNWIGTKAEKVRATDWLLAKGMSVRGHNLVWPGSSYLPDDINANLGNASYLKNRIEGRLDEILDYPGLDGKIYEWDVLNEVTYNRDIEDAFRGEPGYPTGREIYTEIFERAKQLAPEAKLYINDYVTISQYQSEGEIYDRYQSYIQEIIDAGGPIEGIGFQAHIGGLPNSIYQVYDILEDFHQRFGLKAKITEYDTDAIINEDLAADYLRDFLTITFSHPSTDGFLTWGFWDGNHWKNNAPFFRQDWSLKPAGQAFFDLVFDAWWTEEERTTDAAGQAKVRGFKGRYEIITQCGGEVRRDTLSLSENRSWTIDCPDLTVAVVDFAEANLRIYPNPTRGQFVFERPAGPPGTLEVYSATGQRVLKQRVATERTELFLPVPVGIYWLHWRSAGKSYRSRLVVR